uniref:Amino acid permease/ SLC12A domain-containing protein n=1 Tax=Mycena chlorophos TaxID=658473 RepID=A0ABQ0M5W3_MYCCL|nr:predicted protein [Mycena chlorophos]
MSTLTVDISNGIATICLNRPASLNAITMDDYNEFAKVLREIDQREDVLVTVWQATGKWFCAGTDVKNSGAGDRSAVVGNLRESFLKAVVHTTTDCGQALYSHRKVLVAALNGPVMCVLNVCGVAVLNARRGIAAAFLGYFDFIYCMPNAWLSVPFTFIEGGSSVSFINRMGLAKANEALIWGKKKEAQELLECGFINQILPQQSVESFHKAIREMTLKDMEGLDPAAVLEVKRLLKAGLNEKNSLDAVNLRESYAQAARFASGVPARQFQRLANKEIKHKLENYGPLGKPDESQSLQHITAEYEYYTQVELHDPTAVDEKLHRDLKARNISMIALGGAVGTGLIIGSGTALAHGGPLGLFLGYLFVGAVCWFVMIALGEMAAWLPGSKGFAGYATRFVDPALGFGLGWNYLLKYLIVTPNNINAAGVVLDYWSGGRNVPSEAWMIIFIVFIALVNLLGVRVFGELEFWFSSLKVISLIGLILMGIIIDLGGNPHHHRIGFRYWRHPYGPMASYLESVVHNEHLSIFLGFWSTLTNALFAYIGTELVGVTAGEAQNPRRNIPIAIRRTFFRILVFYVGGVFVIGLVVPSTNTSLFTANKAKTGAAASPFVVATTLVGIRTLNHIINAAILVFVLSAANSDLYIGSRTLYGLAIEGKAPSIFCKVNRFGVPWPALTVCTLFCFLVFLNVSSSSAQVFTWFVNLVSTFGALTWISICIAHICFMRALAAQGKSRDALPYKAPLQPFGSWFALISTVIIVIFKGFDTFLPFNKANFVTSYIGVPVFILLWGGYKMFYRTKTIPADKVDLVTGLREIDEAEEEFLAEAKARGPQSLLRRLWDGL